MSQHRLDALVAPHLERLVALRRDVHAHPELGFEEHRTAGVVESTLRELGYETRRPTETGVTADTGAGAAVALRADLDALPLTEATGVEHASTHPGRMHACGHDGHVAILLGTAMALAGVRDRLTGNVRLLFQPAEEGGAGAMKMIEGGALEGVDCIYGLHNWPQLPLGSLATRVGPLLASASEFEVTIRGRGGHGSQPSRAVDPVLPTCHLVTQLQAILSRETEHDAPTAFSVCTIHGGTATNIIPDEVTVSGTVRTVDDAQAEQIGRRIRQIAEGVASGHGCMAQVRYRTYYPVTVNHREEAELVRSVGAELFGEENVSDDGLPMMGAEDFSFYLQRVRGAYFFLGSGEEGRESPPCHSSRYDFNDDLILQAVRCNLRLVEKVLGCTLA